MLKLLRIRGFSAYIVMMFLNAFVDLGHKIVIQNTVFKYYSGTAQIILTALVNALILLPFIMVFTPAGYLSDKYPKTRVLQLSAFAAIVITALITVCYYAGWFMPAFALTFILGLQAAIYSPAKYGYIKEIAGAENIAMANAIVQAVTIIAILMGVFVFSVLFEIFIAPDFSSLSQIIVSVAPLGFLLIGCTVVETVLAFMMPKKRDTDRELSFDYKKYITSGYLRQNLSIVRGSEAIWLSIVGLAIFWGVNQVVLAAFGAYLKETAGVTNTVIAQGLLAVGGIGIIAGSLTAGRVSKNFIETGLIPVGAVGMSAALFVLPSLTGVASMGVLFLLYGFAGGLFIVPLNSLIQFNAREGDLGTVLAGNNFIQNIVMTLFLGFTIVLATGGIGSVPLFYIMFAVVLGGTMYTIVKLPQSFLRYLVSALMSRHYRLQVQGTQNIPATGGVLLLGNHTSYIDWAILQMASPRRLRFVMERSIYERWYLKRFLDLFGVVPISAQASKQAIRTIEELLVKGEAVVLFPEGHISRNGQLSLFHRGYELSVKHTEAVIVPFYIRGLWGSIYSYAAELYKKVSRPGLTRSVTVCFGPAMPSQATAPEVKKAVLQQAICAWKEYTDDLRPLHIEWLSTAKHKGGRPAVINFDDTVLSRHRLLAAGIVFSQEIEKRTSGQQNVGIFLPTSSGGIIALLATLMRGKTTVCLNYTASRESLQIAIEKAGIKTVFTSDNFLKKLHAKGMDPTDVFSGLQVYMLEDIRKEVSKINFLKALLAVKLLPESVLRLLYFKTPSLDDTAAILFSSGSEGVPKGVMLSHRNIICNVKQVSCILNPQEDDVLLNSLPLFHAFGLTATTFVPLIEGIPCICQPDPTNALAVGKLAASYNATLLFATPTFLRLYTREKKLHPLMFQSLRLVIAGAEKLSSDVRTGFKAKFMINVLEGYGATETSPVASCNLPDVLVPEAWFTQPGNKEGSVGMPLPGTTVKIVDPQTLQELPIGEAGLILIGGPQVMKGYFGDEVKTAGVIVEQDGVRWYKSGDKGMLDEDGFLTIVDRYSRFAKIGGEMVGLGAVEEAVMRAIADESIDVAATALPDEKKGEKVVLLVAGGIEPADIKQKLLELGTNPLMLPADYIKVESIPKLGSGKTDFTQVKKLAAEIK